MEYRIEEALDAAFTANWFVWDNDLFVAAFSSQKDAQLFVWAKQLQAMALPKAPAEDIEELKAANQAVFERLKAPPMQPTRCRNCGLPLYPVNNCTCCGIEPSPFAQKLADLVHQTSPYYSPPEENLAAPQTWQGRAFKVEDGCYYFSAKGDPFDWNLGGEHVDSAFMGNIGFGTVTGLRVLDEHRMLIETSNGNYVMCGDPSDGGFIETVTENCIKDESPIFGVNWEGVKVVSKARRYGEFRTPPDDDLPQPDIMIDTGGEG